MTQKIKDRGTATGLALLGLIGLAGLHRFYLGHPYLGILYFFTLGLFGFGTIVDLIWLLTSGLADVNFKSKYGPTPVVDIQSVQQ